MRINSLSPLHLGVVAIEKGALGSPSTTVAKYWQIKNIYDANVSLCKTPVTMSARDLIKENGFTLKMKISIWYSVENMTDADYADELTLPANTSA